MNLSERAVESQRLQRTHLPGRREQLGMTVREADLSLGLNGAGGGLLDTTHFDTVRFPPPDWAISTFAAAAADGTTAYTAYRGSDEVRRLCARSVSGLMGVEIDPSRNIAITAGTQSALFAVLSAVVDEGDVVVLADPEYLFVERMLAFLGAEVRRLPFISTPSGLQPDLDQLDQPDQPGSAGIKLFITSNPNNPTGTVLSPDSVARLAQLAVRDDFLVLIDELYARLVYDDVPYTHLAAQPGMADRAITLLGGSKTESLSGYRVGVVVSSAPVIDAVEQTLAMLCLRAPAYAQHVLTRWLVDDGDFVAKRVSELHDIQRSTIEQLLTVPGLVVAAGSGTAYLWPDVSGLGISGLEAARVLQEKAGVVVSPGYQFGPSGSHHFRICYARDEREWAAALERMTAALRGES